MLWTDLCQGQNLGRANDRRIHAGFAAVVQENRIEHNPGRRRQAETHVANAQHHMHPWQVGANAADCLNRGRTIKPIFLNARGYR